MIFGNHCAVVAELAANSLAPAHPQLALDAPHAFFSPYSLAVALLSRLMSIHPIRALSMAGLINLILLLIGLYFFTRAFSLTNRQGATYYALLFCLTLWGVNPWRFSGFFHLDMLSFDLPSPSTFASAIGLLALALAEKYGRCWRWAKIRPTLTVLDAVRILTDNGPQGGSLADVKKLDTVIAGVDAVAVDSYGATLFGMKGADLGYVRIGAERGLGKMDLEKVQIRKITG